MYNSAAGGIFFFETMGITMAMPMGSMPLGIPMGMPICILMGIPMGVPMGIVMGYIYMDIQRMVWGRHLCFIYVALPLRLRVVLGRFVGCL